MTAKGNNFLSARAQTHKLQDNLLNSHYRQAEGAQCCTAVCMLSKDGKSEKLNNRQHVVEIKIYS